MRVYEDRGRKARDRSLTYALAYWVAGSLWILLSDRLLFGDRGPLLIGSVAKGLGFVTVTALLLWAMLRRNGRHLREAADRAERSEETLRSLLNATDGGIAEVDAEGRLVRWNPAFGDQFGVAEEPVREVGRMMGAGAADLLQPLLRGRSSEPVRFEVLVQSGEGLRLIQVSASPLRPPALGKAVLVTSDLSDRARAERLLKEANERLEAIVRSRTEALEATNRELSAFAASVSHDLRAPIRAIAGYASMVLEDAGDVLDGESRENLERIRSSAGRMAELVESLMRMARVTDRRMEIAEVDVSSLARQIGEEIRSQEPSRSVRLEIQEGMVVQADRTLLASALQNLMSNAWKFTRERDRPEISVRLEETPEGSVLSVSDNGVGFDPRFAEDLFAPFRRAHDPKDYPGEGIGLATVARIAHRHGGRAWAVGKPGEGATFSILLPRRAPERAA
ncbi:MAG: sensor histidine kinase [Fimbriimonadaceae bacterium]